MSMGMEWTQPTQQWQQSMTRGTVPPLCQALIGSHGPTNLRRRRMSYTYSGYLTHVREIYKWGHMIRNVCTNNDQVQVHTRSRLVLLTGFTCLTLLSRRISLSPFPTLWHQSGTISRPSITFQACPSRSFPSSPLHQHSRPSLPFPASLFLSTILLFSPYPVSVLSPPFLSVPCFCPPFSISICTPFLSFCSPFLPGSQLDKAVIKYYY